MAADRLEGGLGLGGVFHPGLALAVIAFAPGLQQRRGAQARQGGGDVFRPLDLGEVGDAGARGQEEPLLFRPVLADRQRPRAGRDRNAEPGQGLDHAGRARSRTRR